MEVQMCPRMHVTESLLSKSSTWPRNTGIAHTSDNDNRLATPNSNKDLVWYICLVNITYVMLSMKALGSGDTVPLILNLGTRRRLTVT
jgi:hypothetical protein